MKHSATLLLSAAIGLLCMAFTAGGCTSGVSSGEPISSAQAHALVENGAWLVDVRSDGEWEEGHLRGAVHIPVDALSARMAELPHEHPVVVYCASGRRSAEAARVLRAAGYDAQDLGGMARWVE